MTLCVRESNVRNVVLQSRLQRNRSEIFLFGLQPSISPHKNTFPTSIPPLLRPHFLSLQESYYRLVPSYFDRFYIAASSSSVPIFAFPRIQESITNGRDIVAEMTRRVIGVFFSFRDRDSTTAFSKLPRFLAPLQRVYNARTHRAHTHTHIHTGSRARAHTHVPAPPDAAVRFLEPRWFSAVGAFVSTGRDCCFFFGPRAPLSSRCRCPSRSRVYRVSFRGLEKWTISLERIYLIARCNVKILRETEN